MHPINPHHQEKQLENAKGLALPVAIVGMQSVLKLLPQDSLLHEIEQGAWDGVITHSSVGPHGQSLLLTLLGTQWAELALPTAFRRDSPPIEALARALVGRGADPLARDNAGRDSLDQAFAAAHVSLVKEWITRLPASSIQERRVVGSGGTVLPWLHQASLAGHLEMIEALLAAGVSVDHVNEQGETALFWAKSPEIVERLLARGANPLHRNAKQQDAKVFWLTDRDLPQQMTVSMKAALPRQRLSAMPREQAVHDFYASAQTAGKGVLEPSLKKLNLRPDEFDKDGFGVLGNLGSRLLDPASCRDGMDRRRSLAWAEYICAHPLASHASRRDLLRLWAGCCQFGGTASLQVGFGITRHAYAQQPGFWTDALSTLLHVAPTDASRRTGMLENAAWALASVMEKSNDRERTKEVAPLFLQCLLLACQSRGYSYSGPMRSNQEKLLSHMKNHPEWELQADALAWQVALQVDRTTQSYNQPKLSTQLLAHLEEAGTPYPANMSVLLMEALEGADGAAREHVSILSRSLLDRSTQSSPQASRKVRL